MSLEARVLDSNNFKSIYTSNNIRAEDENTLYRSWKYSLFTLHNMLNINVASYIIS